MSERKEKIKKVIEDIQKINVEMPERYVFKLTVETLIKASQIASSAYENTNMSDEDKAKEMMRALASAKVAYEAFYEGYKNFVESGKN